MNQPLSSSSSTDSILGYHNVYYDSNNIHDSNQNSVVELSLSPTVVGSGSRSVRSIQEKDRASTVPSKSKGKFSRFFSFSSSSSLNSSNSSTSSSSTLLSPTSTTNSSISSDSLISSSLSCYKCCSDYTMSYYSPAYRTNPIPSSNTTTTTTNNNNSNGGNSFFSSSSSSSPSSNTSSNNNNTTSQQYRYQYSQSKAERILRNYRAKKTCLTMNEVSLMFVKEYYDTCNENSKHENNNDCCSICLSDFNQKDIVYNLPCTHTYHSACLDPWFLSTAATCPLCNRNYKTEADKLRSMFNEMVTISQTKKKFNYI